VENYIINNKTIAILKKNNKTIIFDVENTRVINKNIKKILDYNCNFYGSSLLGRKKCAESILNIHYKIPLIIDKNIILLQLNGIKDEECLFIVLNKIIDYKYTNKNLNILCINNRLFKTKISKYSFEKMLINAFKLNNILKWRKNVNFV